VRYWDFRGEHVMVYTMIDAAAMLHVADVITRQTAVVLCEAVVRAWNR
jgi:hypothetical protein